MEAAAPPADQSSGNGGGYHGGYPKVDTQTRIGIGASAALGIIGTIFPMIGLWIAGPLMTICGIIAIWGLWPLIDLIFRVGLPLGYFPLNRAAAKLFGQMQDTAAAEFARR